MSCLSDRFWTAAKYAGSCSSRCQQGSLGVSDKFEFTGRLVSEMLKHLLQVDFDLVECLD